MSENAVKKKELKTIRKALKNGLKNCIKKFAREMQRNQRENSSCPRLRTACEQASLLSSCLPWSFEGIELTRQPKFSLLWVCTSLLACNASSSLQLAADASLSGIAEYKKRVAQGTDLMSWGESSAPASLHSRFQGFLSVICEVPWVSNQNEKLEYQSVKLLHSDLNFWVYRCKRLITHKQPNVKVDFEAIRGV
jgi:hypothetical protein